MALFHFLCSNRKKLEINVIALHVNHGLREESREEEAFVEGYCRSMGIQCITTRLCMNDREKPQGKSTETWARELRYKFFFEQAEKFGAVLATAHTASDRAETVIFNITRGASLKGASGIPPVRDSIVRPLIDCTRREIEEYCTANNIPYVNDRTNFEDIYSRNKIRLNVIPQLKKINPSVENTIGDFAKENREVYSLLEEMSESLYRKALGLGGLDVGILLSEHPAVVKNLLRDRLDKLDCLSRDNIYAIYEGMKKGSFRQQLSSKVFCEIKDGRLTFYSPDSLKKVRSEASVDIKLDEMTQFAHSSYVFSIISCDEFHKIKENDKNYLTYCVNYDKIKGILKLRGRKQGDRFTLYHRNVTKTLKKLFVEDKVPQNYRDSIRVLTDDTDNVIWLADYGTNKPYVPQDSTQKILLIKQM
ncbi:MAG: tRNA lysidine(34) synthetase TilS [Oscillospiraceae bacterium]|nr:tRNA lysidine(34) synthetase TilS [Oscillospiraceae bacterium]